MLPIDQLIDIIGSDELNVTHEENVYNAVMTWIKYDLLERKQHLVKVVGIWAWLLPIGGIGYIKWGYDYSLKDVVKRYYYIYFWGSLFRF